MKKKVLKHAFVSLFCLLFLFFFTVHSFATPMVELPPTTGASAVYLYHYESNQVLLKRSNAARLLPASTVKMMTGLLALEHLEGRLEEYVRIEPSMLAEVQGVTVRLEPNTSVRIVDLLYGVICGGGNDAATVLAILCSGSVEAFVEEMNQQAKEWGCLNTTYKNPTGIDETGMYTTLEDTAIIAKHAVEHDLFLEISAAASYSYKPLCAYESTLFYNRNALISSFSAIGYQNRYAKGLNAGMTDGGGYCVCTYASNGTDSYLCVVMGAVQLSDGTILSYSTANSLLTELFDSYSYRTIASKGAYICSVPISLALPKSGEKESVVSCVLSEDLCGFLPNDVETNDLTYHTYLHEESVIAPIEAGTVIGGVEVCWQDQVIAQAKLVSSESVDSVALLVAMDQMKSALLSRTAVLILVSFLLIFGGYSLIGLFQSKRRKKQQKRWR